VPLEIIIAGRGGQGILLAGYLLGRALIDKGYYVVNSEMYSAETRGGFSRSDLIVFRTREETDTIKVSRADIAVFMYYEQMYSYADYVKQEPKLVLLDSTYIEKPARNWPNIVEIPITELAKDLVGTTRVANVFMLGVLGYTTDLVDPETMERTILSKVSPKWREVNINAFRKGYEYAENNLRKVHVEI